VDVLRIKNERSLFMKPDRPSRTATYMALFRALETCRPRQTRLFDDRYAVALLSGSLRAVARLACLPLIGSAVPWLLDRGWPHTRSSAVVRTRLIDDAVTEALDDGAVQLLLLGAGLDSRPYRLLAGRSVAGYEVDHPATQRTKCERLRAVLGTLPANVSYLPVDFERDDLEIALQHAGYDPARPSVVVWEGVVSYLSAESVDRNVRVLARLCTPRSRLIFTYVHRGALDGSVHFAEAARWSGWVRLNNEPFVFGFAPAELPGYLAARGFRLLTDVSTAEAAARYCPPLHRTEPGSHLYHVAIAERT
jgi:methyltransferase (TIGR00027 family)